MFNLIREAIDKKGIKVTWLSTAIGYGYSSLSKKLVDESSFPTTKLDEIINILDLESERKYIEECNRAIKTKTMKKKEMRQAKSITNTIDADKEHRCIVMDNINIMTEREIAERFKMDYKRVEEIKEKYEIDRYPAWTHEELEFLFNNSLMTTTELSKALGKEIRDVEFKTMKYKNKIKQKHKELDFNISVGDRIICEASQGNAKDKCPDIGECKVIGEYENYFLLQVVKTGVKECLNKGSLIAGDYKTRRA